MSGLDIVLLVVGLLAAFLLGLLAARLLRKSQSTAPVVAGHHSLPESVPGVTSSTATSAQVDLPFGYGSGGGLEVFAWPVPANHPVAWRDSARSVSKASHIAAELGRLATGAKSLESRSDEVFHVVIKDGTFEDLMKVAGGGRYGDVVDEVTHKVTSKAVLHPLTQSKEMLALLGPQAVWGLAAFAVGQHLEAEIARRLEAIEKNLDLIIEEIDRERLANLAGASRECHRAAYRILDGRSAREVVAALSAQKQAIDTGWELALTSLQAAEEKLNGLEAAEDLTPLQVERQWEEMFGKNGFARETRLFLAAWSAKVQLIALLAADAADEADSVSSAPAYTAFLRREMAECNDALQRLRSIVHRTLRLDYSLGMNQWLPASLVLKGKKARSDRLLTTIGSLYQIEDDLERLDLPFADSGAFPRYEMLAQRKPDGSVQLELTRAVIPTELESV